MRLLAIIAVLAAFPGLYWALGFPRARRWIFIAAGALPILYEPLHLGASLVSWALWPGYVRGLSLTIVDAIAVAICLRYGRGRPVPALLWAFVIYIVCLTPSALLASFHVPAVFVLFQVFRVTLFFYAVYLATLNGQLLRIAEGLAIAAMANGAVSAYHSLSGAVQAEGILGHQNLSGMATNLCVPILLALALRTRRPLFIAGVAAAVIGALAGGSRATMILLAMAMLGTLAATMIVRPSGRTILISALALIGLLASAPFAAHKLTERNVAGFDLDPERLAFDRTAELMIKDHPWGAGLNQYVSVANTAGYFDRAGVRWGYDARSTNVHNVYLLVRAEAGLLGLCGLLIWLLSPILLAASCLFRRRLPLREVTIASGFALVGVALHSRYEWVLVTATPQYLVALCIGVIAALSVYPTPTATSNRSKRAPIEYDPVGRCMRSLEPSSRVLQEESKTHERGSAG